MNIVSTNLSKKAILNISQSIIHDDFNEGGEVELVIICEPPFILREFTAYLTLADKIYGRLLDWNLSSYSHKQSIQLKITEVRFGSFELVTVQEVSSYITPLAILWLILKYLPDALKTTSEAYKNWREARYKIPAEAEKLYKESIKFDEESKIVIINRKKLKEELRKDKRLATVEEKYLEQIPQLFKEILAKETKLISKARKFSVKNVKDVKIQKRRKNISGK